MAFGRNKLVNHVAELIDMGDAIDHMNTYVRDEKYGYTSAAVDAAELIVEHYVLTPRKKKK